MKKPAKPAAKKAAPAAQKNVKKAAPAKPAAKKAPAKPAAKAAAKPAAKAAKKPAAPVKAAKKAAPAPKATAKAPAKAGNIAKKIQEKIAATKKAKEVKATKKEAAVKKGLAKPVAVKAAPVKATKIVAKPEPKATKKAEVVKPVKKEVVKAPSKAEIKAEQKAAAKKAEAEKPKKLSKKEEKELLKAKGKKGAPTFEEEMEEEASKARGDEEEEDDDFEGETPKKVKMTFDEIEEEEIIPVRKKGKAGLDDDIKENLAEEILALAEDFSIEDVFGAIRNMDLFKVESDECVVRGCDNPATTNGYCRYHYIKLWKDVKKKEAILAEGRLAKIIEDLVRKYPMKYIETIIHDLADDKAFNHVLKDLDIETDEAELDAFEDDELLDDDQDIAFETKVVKPSFDD